jgi:hypothetical protein
MVFSLLAVLAVLILVQLSLLLSSDVQQLFKISLQILEPILQEYRRVTTALMGGIRSPVGVVMITECLTDWQALWVISLLRLQRPRHRLVHVHHTIRCWTTRPFIAASELEMLLSSFSHRIWLSRILLVKQISW